MGTFVQEKDIAFILDQNRLPSHNSSLEKQKKWRDIGAIHSASYHALRQERAPAHL